MRLTDNRDTFPLIPVRTNVAVPDGRQTRQSGHMGLILGESTRRRSGSWSSAPFERLYDILRVNFNSVSCVLRLAIARLHGRQRRTYTSELRNKVAAKLRLSARY